MSKSSSNSAQYPSPLIPSTSPFTIDDDDGTNEGYIERLTGFTQILFEIESVWANFQMQSMVPVMVLEHHCDPTKPCFSRYTFLIREIEKPEHMRRVIASGSTIMS